MVALSAPRAPARAVARHSLSIFRIHNEVLYNPSDEKSHNAVKFVVMNSAGAQPHTSEEFFRRGLTLSKEGHWKEAVTAYKESLRLDPNNPQTYLNLGFVYYELGYDREAQDAFDKASKLQARPCVR